MVAVARRIETSSSSDSGLRKGLLLIILLIAGLAATGLGGFALMDNVGRSGKKGAPAAGGVFLPLPAMAFVLSDGSRTQRVDLNVVLELPTAVEPAEMVYHAARIVTAMTARMVEVDADSLRGAPGTEFIKEMLNVEANRELRPMRVRQVLLQNMVMY